MRFLLFVLVVIVAASSSAEEAPPWAKADLRAGIIGTDTSHVPAFTGLFHRRPEWRIKVVAAFKAGSPDLPISADRVERFATTINEQYDVELVESIDALLEKVDVVLLQSVDGRPHLRQARPVFKAGKRLFIDKPLAASLEDAREIVRLSKATGTPFFSSSSARFHPDIPRLRDSLDATKATKVQGASPLSILEFHPDLFFYGIHGVEPLYAVLGPGCVSLSRRVGEDVDITTGTWRDGRTGVYLGVRKGERPPAVRVWGADGVAETTGGASHEGLVEAIAKFFHTGAPPVAPEETLEVFEFMTAAQLSKERDGAEVRLNELRD